MLCNTVGEVELWVFDVPAGDGLPGKGLLNYINPDKRRSENGFG
ncbi:hypothetical protein DCCM_3786 [Desulfocucumis palustris]|uniref:Uncharacterized protein n=1 Tax=Desulfocucumis palustris TaxID=1898651 RepID=A0A2L2XK51_9FIRM|nr:hypothetical protein DCCM_3786 [Desulfocucumis palustris]